MLGKRCLGPLGSPMEYYYLPEDLKRQLKRMFEMEDL